MNALKFVAQHVKNQDNFNSVSCLLYIYSLFIGTLFTTHGLFQFADDWKYVAMVLDRILLWFFTVACVVGKFNNL